MSLKLPIKTCPSEFTSPRGFDPRWTDGRAGGRAGGRTGGRAGGRVGGRADGRADGQTGGRTGGRAGYGSAPLARCSEKVGG